MLMDLKLWGLVTNGQHSISRAVEIPKQGEDFREAIVTNLENYDQKKASQLMAVAQKTISDIHCNDVFDLTS